MTTFTLLANLHFLSAFPTNKTNFFACFSCTNREFHGAYDRHSYRVFRLSLSRYIQDWCSVMQVYYLKPIFGSNVVSLLLSILPFLVLFFIRSIIFLLVKKATFFRVIHSLQCSCLVIVFIDVNRYLLNRERNQIPMQI